MVCIPRTLPLKLMVRMTAMQKMQAAAGNKPLGPNGQPSPQQIEAMRVRLSVCEVFG